MSFSTGVVTMVPSMFNQVEVAFFQLESMAQQVEKAVQRAIASFAARDKLSARQVIEDDKVINSFEIDIDNSSYNIFALSAEGIPPELLRKILSIQKINPILERIGDHAVNIAEAVITLSVESYREDIFLVEEMADKCRNILRDALEAFFSTDTHLAEEVLQSDREIDDRHDRLIGEIKSSLLTSSPHLSFEAGFTLFRIAKDLERIADLSMNIAEETLYAVEGTVVKHQMSADGL